MMKSPGDLRRLQPKAVQQQVQQQIDKSLGDDKTEPKRKLIFIKKKAEDGAGQQGG